MKKLVIIPGGFHPFHAGHMSLYNAAREAFPSADVYVAATADTSSRPFPFRLKKMLATAAGVPVNRFIQVKSPFRAEEITQHYDPNTTQLIFVRSNKDKDVQPVPGGTRKDGTPSYLQPYKRRGLQPMNKQGYMAYLPTVQFGPGMTSATEIRSKWPEMDADNKIKLIQTLYPNTQGNDKGAQKLVDIMDQVLSEGLAGAVAGGIAGAALTRTPAGAVRGAQMGSAVQNAVSNEATMHNSPEGEKTVYPDGGMGGYSPDGLERAVVRHFEEILRQAKSGNIDNVAHLLYQSGVIESKLRALQQYNRFVEKRGRRPLAKDREYDLANEDYLDENTLSEKWSQSYKDSIDCSNPKGFSQRAHCAGKNK